MQLQPWSRMGASVEGLSRRKMKLQVSAQASDGAATPAKRGLSSRVSFRVLAGPRNETSKGIQVSGPQAGAKVETPKAQSAWLLSCGETEVRREENVGSTQGDACPLPPAQRGYNRILL